LTPTATEITNNSIENPTEICYDDVAADEADSPKGESSMRQSESCMHKYVQGILIGADNYSYTESIS